VLQAAPVCLAARLSADLSPVSHGSGHEQGECGRACSPMHQRICQVLQASVTSLLYVVELLGRSGARTFTDHNSSCEALHTKHPPCVREGQCCKLHQQSYTGLSTHANSPPVHAVCRWSNLTSFPASHAARLTLKQPRLSPQWYQPSCNPAL
jgi:hypothetical protein